MLFVLALLAFLVSLVVNNGGDEFLSLDWVGWMLIGFMLFTAGHLYGWAPWTARRSPPQ